MTGDIYNTLCGDVAGVIYSKYPVVIIVTGDIYNTLCGDNSDVLFTIPCVVM